MQLYMVRHGVAVDPSSPLVTSDSQRALTERGRAEMALHARALKRMDIAFEAVLTSPLVRAMQTAEIVCRVLECPERLVVCNELAPGCQARSLGPVLQGYASAKAVALVGHNPDFEDMAGALIGGAGGAIVFKKGGICRIDLDHLEPHPGGSLIWHLSPKILRLLGK
jgi:phosphohistidine phosphatase